MNEIISKTKHGLLIKENNIDLYIDEINNYLNFSINEFNKFLYEGMIKAEEIALKNVGR